MRGDAIDRDDDVARRAPGRRQFDGFAKFHPSREQVGKQQQQRGDSGYYYLEMRGRC